ncbi:MAG: hypothetical protein QM698_10065 [Micropepsaceae bacterium]
MRLASGFGLTALALILGASAFAATGEVKGPVHISSKGVTDFGGDTASFQAAMDADEREDAGHVELAVERTIIRSHDEAEDQARIAAAEARDHARRTAYEARAHARRISIEARAHAKVIAHEARQAARAAADEARAAAREAAHEAQRAAREAMEEARVEISRAMATADRAVREAHEKLREAHVQLRQGVEDMKMDERDWRNAVEIRDGKVVRCNNPEKYPGTGCTPFTAEEKARIEAEIHAAAERAEAAASRIEAEIREADRAIED